MFLIAHFLNNKSRCVKHRLLVEYRYDLVSYIEARMLFKIILGLIAASAKLSVGL